MVQSTASVAAMAGGATHTIRLAISPLVGYRITTYSNSFQSISGSDDSLTFKAPTPSDPTTNVCVTKGGGSFKWISRIGRAAITVETEMAVRQTSSVASENCGFMAAVYHQRKEKARPVGCRAMAARWVIRRARTIVIGAGREANKEPAGVFGVVLQPMPPFRGQEGTSGRVQCSGIKLRLAMRIVAATKKPAAVFVQLTYEKYRAYWRERCE
jgi:hypothetical protein